MGWVGAPCLVKQSDNNAQHCCHVLSRVSPSTARADVGTSD